MSFQKIKSEPLGEENHGLHKDLNERAEDIPNICYDHEDKIPIKEEIKQEFKPEPLGERVVEELNDDVIERAEDFSGICFDHENNIPIKKEIKQEIKPEPLDKDNIDFETNSCENDQEKRDLQAMVDKLLIEKQTLQKEKDYFKGKLEDKVKEFEKLQIKNQNLKSEKNHFERQLEDKEKKYQELRKRATLPGVEPPKKLKKSVATQPAKFKCDRCGKQFTQIGLKRHITYNEACIVKCEICGRGFGIDQRPCSCFQPFTM